MTGALVNSGTIQDTGSAAARDVAAGFYFDTPGAVAGQQYSLTVQQITATTAGTFGDLAMLVFSL